MHIVLGGTGHLGSATVRALLARGEPVTLVTRNVARGEEWRNKGARIAVCDVLDVARLRAVFATGRRLFLVNPPANPATDIDVEERRTATAIVSALEGSKLEGVVAVSTYGARPCAHCADLGVLYELEQALAAQNIPSKILRVAYLMTNWDAQLEVVRDGGVLSTMLPARMRLPMVAPADVGAVAARFLSESSGKAGLEYVEGPQRYSPADVAAAFSKALGRPVNLDVTPPEKWGEVFEHLGFSPQAADSYARMTQVTLESLELPDQPLRGAVSLDEHVGELVRPSAKN
jgi:uncharacterized protein YbjT (DUF2867 family)